MKYAIISSQTFENQKYAEQSFLGAELENCVFIHCDFQEAFLAGAKFSSCEFLECNFDEAYIFRSQFKNCLLVECQFNDTMLSTVDFTGTNFVNVLWHDTIINSAPLIVDGIEYPIVALDNGYMHVGCEFNTYEWFYNTDEKHSARMEGLRARRFWKKHRQVLFDLLKVRGLYDPEKK